MDNKEVKLEFELNYLNILKEDEDCSIVQLDLLHLGDNRNRCNISKECVDKSLPTFFNKPIIYRLNNKYFPQDSTDVVEHARDEEQEDSVLIAGTIPESSPVEFIERDGRTYLRMIGVIHKLYQPILLNILKRRNGETKVSIELKVMEGYQNDAGILVIDEFKFLSVCLLGKDMKEGIEGSELIVTKFSLNENVLDETIKKYNKHYLIFSQNEQELSNNNQDTYAIPTIIRNNAINGLSLKKKYGRGMTSVGKSIANYLINNPFATKEKVNDIFKYLSNHEQYEIDNKNISNEYISWLAFGGNEAYEWSKSIIKNKDIQTFIAKDKVGTGNAITIDKNKDSLSDGEWSDKGIKKDCLLASNYKAVCKAVFMKIENGYEDGVESKLGYPVMEKKGDKVVYNCKGLASAKGYAEKNNETSVLSELKAIYKHLELPWDGENIKNNKKEEDNELENDNKEINKDTIKNSTDDECKEKETNTAKVDEKPVEECKETSKNTEDIQANAEEVVDNSCDKNKEFDTLKNEFDDFKQKYSELETECKNTKAELQKYKDAEKEQIAKNARKAEEDKMCNLLEQYAHCFSEDEGKDMKSEISKCSFEDFEKKVDNKIKEFALHAKDKKVEETKDEKDKSKEDKKEDKLDNALKFSVSPFGTPKSYDFSKNLGEGGLDSIIKNSGVKIK